MKNVQKFLCILLASVMICMTPMAEYVNINQIKTVEAADPITATLLLEFILAACGVTVAANALDNAADAFEDWLGNNGSDDAISNWNAAKTMGTISISAPLITSVMAWIGEKFGDLNNGYVSTVDNNTTVHCGVQMNSYMTVAFSKFISAIPFNSHYFAVVDEHTVDSGSCSVRVYCLDQDCVVVKVGSSGFYLYRLVDGFLERIQFLDYKSSGYYGNFNFSTYAASVYSGASDKSLTFYSDRAYLSTCAFLSVDRLIGNISLSDALEVADFYANFDSLPDAYTSFGNYDTQNINDLAGLILTPAIISAIMAKVNDAISVNKTDDGWSETVAQAIADAYAQGLADAKAQQGELEDEAKEQEKINTLTGWMSKILDAVTSLPLTIFQLFVTTLTDGFGIVSSVFDTTVEIKDLITSIPMTLAECFVEVFPSAQYVGELITGIPASIVDALIEVFPASEQLFEWITSIPVSIVDAIGIGVGTLTDGLIAVKEAVLAIPGTISDAIAIALAALFTPDIAVVEPQLKEIEDNLLWIEDVKDIVDDMRSELKAGEPPVLYLDFTKAEDSKYHGAGRCLAIDFSWYAKYKATGDLVFGAFLWIIYIWYLFKRFPDIISGAGFVTRESINSHNRAAADARQSELNKAGVVGKVKIIDHRGGK